MCNSITTNDSLHRNVLNGLLQQSLIKLGTATLLAICYLKFMLLLCHLKFMQLLYRTILLQGVLWSTKPTWMSFISDREICVVRLQQLSDFCWSWTEDRHKQSLWAGMKKLKTCNECNWIQSYMNMHAQNYCIKFAHELGRADPIYTNMAGNRKPYCLCDKMPVICASSRNMYVQLYACEGQCPLE